MKQLGKIGRIVNGKIVVVAHVLTDCVMDVKPYKFGKLGYTKKCPWLICFLTDG